MNKSSNEIIGSLPRINISIIIVAWNSKKYLHHCLEALSRQKYQEFEIIIVDNGSDDNAVRDLEVRWPQLHLKIEELATNLGFAVANNIGVRLARGKWIALLNADAFPEPDWLEQFLRASNENPGFTFFSSRQVQANTPELLDGAGDDYHISGLAWRKHYNQPSEEFGHKQEEVFSACAAAAMYRRNDFLEVGGFDEDYFSYFEDVDLSFRLRLAGGRCLYVSSAIVYHVGSASTGKLSDFVIYHGHRNLVWTFIKDMPGILFCLFLPLHLAMNIFFLISFALRGKGNTIFKAKLDAFRKIPAMWKKRKDIQSRRTISDLAILPLIKKGILDPYWASRLRARK